mgnify:CR=1 FL=1
MSSIAGTSPMTSPRLPRSSTRRRRPRSPKRHAGSTTGEASSHAPENVRSCPNSSTRRSLAASLAATNRSVCEKIGFIVVCSLLVVAGAVLCLIQPPLSPPPSPSTVETTAVSTVQGKLEESENTTCIRQVVSMQTMSVQVPQGLKGGMSLPVRTLGGVMPMQIPPGLQPGMLFDMPVPMSHAHDYCEIDKYGNFKQYPECERCRLQAALAVIKRNSASLANADLASLEPVKSVVLPPPAPPSSPPPPPPAPPPLRPSPLMPSPSPVLSPLCIVGVLMLLWWPSIPSQVLSQPRAGAGDKSWPIEINLTGAYGDFGDGGFGDAINFTGAKFVGADLSDRATLMPI